MASGIGDGVSTTLLIDALDEVERGSDPTSKISSSSLSLNANMNVNAVPSKEHDDGKDSSFARAAGSMLSALGCAASAPSSKMRVAHIKKNRDVARFTDTTCSLMAALEDCEEKKLSPLEEAVKAQQEKLGPRDAFGRGLKVIDHFALKVHSVHDKLPVVNGLQFNVRGSSEAGKNNKGAKKSQAANIFTLGLTNPNAITSNNNSGGGGNNKNKNKKLSKKARQRMDKTKQRGIAYAERNAGGPSRRRKGKIAQVRSDLLG